MQCSHPCTFQQHTDADMAMTDPATQTDIAPQSTRLKTIAIERLGGMDTS